MDKALRHLQWPPEAIIVVGGDETPSPHRLHPIEAPASQPGMAAGLAIEAAVGMAMAGDVAGIVTAPIHKPALHDAGFAYPGHTEMLRALTSSGPVGMLMCMESGDAEEPALRVLLATTHVPLRDVPSLVTAELLIGQTRLLVTSLRSDWGIETPRIALCAFNPHASDGGLFGDEEERVYGPALDALRAEGSAVTGPVPADTVFHRARSGEFDAVVAPYHDVGMAAFKTASFGRGVNVTLGLPFLRTSPDHGTAFDIAGRGIADPTSMIEAIELAGALSVRRRRMKRGPHMESLP